MFLAPAFLLGLLAIGVPLWLHRVARANPTQFPFASLMLLEASESQRTAKRTLRYWLLLITRILLLAALVLAFAGPLVTERIVPRAGSDTRLHAIVLDSSLSMQYPDRWSRAIAAAEEVLVRARSSDRVMLVTAAGRRVEVLHDSTPATAAGALRATLRGLQPGIERLDYGLAMSTANGWLGSPRPPVTLHLISDLQRSAAPLRFADLEPPPQTQLQLHDVSSGPAANAYIESASLTTLDTRALDVVIRNTAAQPQQRDVLLFIDGREAARQQVRLEAVQVSSTPAGEGDGSGEPAADDVTGSKTQRVLFPDLKLAAGTHRIEIALEPKDALPQDDRHFAVVEHAEPKALLIARDAKADGAAYFSSAIGSLTAPRIAVEQRAADTISSGALSGYSIVVIADVGVLSDGAARRVREFAAAGGAVLATLGGDSAAATTPLLEGIRIGDARPNPTRIGEVATTHPVLRDAADWHRVRFFRQHSVQVTDQDQVLMRQQDGSPLLIERAMGAGRILLLTAPIERRWNDLAVHPLFVKFVADAARYLLGPDAAAASSTVGSVVMTGLTAAGGGQIFDPQGKRVLGLAQSNADRLIPEQAGFYEIRSDAGVRWLAANVDARESDLTALPGTFVQRWQAMRLRSPPTQVTATPEPQPQSRSLGTSLLWIAALLLIAEMLLANRHLAIRREVPR
jgi:Aerotolerance regulator N-terminal/von Willebrand factor type A domain